MRWICHFSAWGSKLSSPMVFLLFDKFVIFFLVKLSSAHFCRSEANILQILLFQSSIFCCLALEEGSQYPKVHAMQRNSFHRLFHHLSRRHCYTHQTSMRPPFFPATSLPSSSQYFLCIKKIPHQLPQWFFSVLLLRDCVTSLRSCKCLPWQPNDVGAKFTCFLP